MTNELEKQFFDTFGIEPIVFAGCSITRCINQHISNCTVDCPFFIKGKTRYPQISDSILLELICIVTNHTDIIRGFASVENLKTFVLEELIYDIAQMKDEDTKHQVRTLFEEG